MPLSQKTLQKYLAELRRIEKHRTASAEKNIRRIYKALVKDLNGFLGNEYVTYGEDGVLNVSMLQEKLRYARFLEEVEAKLNSVSFETAKIIRELVEQTYSAVYVGMVEAVKQSEYGETLAPFLNGMSLRPEVIKRAMENPVSGLTLPDILEKRRKEVIYDIKQQVNIGLMNGDRYSDVAKKITDRVDINYRKAITTVRTESHRVIEGGLHDSALDVMEAAEGSGLIYTKRWQTMKDERVRPQVRRKTKKGWKTYRSSSNADHMKMDGVVIKVDELFDLGGGVTTTAPGQSGVAGQDINCRCMLVYEWLTLEEYAEATGVGVNELAEQSGKPVTPITQEAINRVEKVSIPGYSDGECEYIKQQHQELLQTAMLDNDSKEIAFVHSRDFRHRRILWGDERRINLSTDKLNIGKGLLVMHNHPINSGFSRSDMVKFLADDNIKTLTIVKNNGNVEAITKRNKIGGFKIAKSFVDLKLIKNATPEQVLKHLLTKGVIFWIK